MKPLPEWGAKQKFLTIFIRAPSRAKVF